MPSDQTDPYLRFLDPMAIEVRAALDRWTGGPADLKLMESIATQSLLEPIGVAGTEDTGWTLAYGSRRLGAWRRSPFLMGRMIPAVVVPTGAALHATLDENTLRVQLNVRDKARLAKDALERSKDAPTTEHALGKSLGLSASRLAQLKKAWSDSEVWDRVEKGNMPVASATTISRMPPDKRAALLAKLDAEHPKANSAEIERVVRDMAGVSISEKLPGDDLRVSAAALVDHFVSASPGVSKLTFHVDYEAATTVPTLVLRLPLNDAVIDDVHDVIQQAKDMLPAEQPTPEPEPTPAPKARPPRPSAADLRRRTA